MWSIICVALSFISNLQEVRTVYKDAINSSSQADKLVTITEKQKSTALLRAYYGTGLALQAKHSWSPATKLSKAALASAELNAAVTSNANDLEIRFLRFSFEANAPSFLGYSSHLATDKTWILAHLDKGHAMWDVMKSYLNNCDQLTEAEKKKL